MGQSVKSRLQPEHVCSRFECAHANASRPQKRSTCPGTQELWHCLSHLLTFILNETERSCRNFSQTRNVRWAWMQGEEFDSARRGRSEGNQTTMRLLPSYASRPTRQILSIRSKDGSTRMVTVEPTKPLQSIEYWCQRSEAGEKAGDYLEACDSALLGLEQHPSDRELQYRAVLALSRAGANKRASQLWAKYALERPRDASVSGAQLEENIAALGARLDREAAFAANPAQRREKLKAAAARRRASSINAKTPRGCRLELLAPLRGIG